MFDYLFYFSNFTYLIMFMLSLNRLNITYVFIYLT
jgi:hypothetical protein